MGQTTVTITAGTPQTVTVNAQARWLEVLNDSPNYLYFQLGPDPPRTLASTGTYANVVKPFGDKAITIPAPNSGTAFDGAVYIYPVAPTGLSTTASPSVLTTVILVTYTQFEGPPIQIASMPRQMDATSQQRIITLPTVFGAPSNNPNFTSSFAAPGTGTFGLPAVGSTFLIYNGGGAFGAALPSGIGAAVNDTWAFLVYAINIYCPFVGTAGAVQFTLNAVVINTPAGTVNTVLNPPLAFGFIYWGVSGANLNPWQMPNQGHVVRGVTVVPSSLVGFTTGAFGLQWTTQAIGSGTPVGAQIAYECMAYSVDVSPSPGVAGTLPYTLGVPRYATPGTPILF